jgi:hypothetical protein
VGKDRRHPIPRSSRHRRDLTKAGLDYRDVNIGLGLATGDYIAVVNNDCCLAEGDVYDLCVPETVTSPTADRADGKGHGADCFLTSQEAQEYGIIDNLIAHR